MTREEIKYKLFNGGRFALPWLIKFSCDNLEPIYLVNNNDSIVYDNNTYNASNFEYNEPDILGKGASLSITGIDNDLIPFVENANYKMKLEIVGVLAEDSSTVTPIKIYNHAFGSATYNNKMELKFTLGRDDRLDMTFPPYKFDTDNNRGNA